MGKIDLTGQRFGRLVVLCESGRTKSGNVLYLCRCDCSNEVIVNGSHLRSGHTTSCGCYKIERVVECNTTHGLHGTRLYKIWSAMLVRAGVWKCTKESDKRNYQYRGITVCEEWLNFENFRDWALAHGYRDGLEIDRYDNDRGYCPQNCRWVTRKENMNNRRCTLRLDDGTPLAMFCSSIGIETCEEGGKTPKYARIGVMWSKSHKIHPELMQALKDDIEKQSRLLEMTKLKCRRAELMIEAAKKLVASKQTA